MHNNPYVGPRPYERADRDNFFGRGRETRDLLALMLAERVLLFYAQSGAGKTSLLNAQVIPALEDKGFDVLPVARVGSDLPPGIDPAQVKNVFVFSALMGLAGGDVAPETLLELTLLSFLQARLTDKPPLLILDQFEELFTTHHDRWQEARDFFVQVRQALDGIPNLGVTLAMREDHIAELDPYALLLPGRLRARFRMERLGPQATVEAVVKPATNAGCSFDLGVAERLVDDLRRIKTQEAGSRRQEAGSRSNEAGSKTQEAEGEGQERGGTFASPPKGGIEGGTLGPYVEPVQLQVVCNRLWERLPDQYDNAIQWEEVEQYGNIDRALVDFYESALAKTRETCQVSENLTGLTVTERHLRRWFSEELITPMETRGLAMRGPEDTAGLPNAAVDVLEAQHLIRADVRAGARWYELCHDRMVEPIVQSNWGWEAAQENLHPWRPVARQWEKAPSETLLYRGKELAAAQTWLAAAAPDEVEDYEREFIEASGEAERTRWEALKRRRRLMTASAVVGILMIMLTFISIWQWQYAEQQTVIAQEASTRAVAESTVSAQERATAIAAKATAEAALVTAEEARIRANENAEEARKALVTANAAATAEAIARRETETLRQIAVARQLAAQGQALIPSPIGLLLDVESLGITSTIESRQAIRQGLRQLLPLATRIEYEAQIASVAFTPNGEWIAVGSYDGLVYISDTTTGREITRLMCIEGIQKLVFSPDGNWLAIRSMTEVELKRVGNWDSVTFSILDEKVTELTFSPDGQWLAIQEETNVQIWHMATDTWEEVVRIPNEVMKFSLDGRWLAVVTLDGSVVTVQVWQLQMPWQQPFQTLTQRTEGVYYVPLLNFSPDGQWVMLATQQGELEGQVTIWETITGEPKLNSSESVYDAAFSPDSQWVVWANYWADATVWKVGVWTEPQILKGLSFEFSSDNRWLATYEQWIVESGSNATLSVWDMKTWENIMNTPLGIHVTDMTLTPGGNRLIISGVCLEGEDCYNRVSVVEAQTWKEKRQLLERAWADYSSDGRWMATIEGNVVQIWDIGLRKRETILANTELSYHDGQWLNIDDRDMPDDIWETVDTDQVFSPDGEWLVQTDNRIVYLKKAETLKELLRLPHRWSVRTLAFNSNGRWLVTGSSEDVAQPWIYAGKKEIRVWDLVTGREIERIELEGSDVNMEVAFSPNDQYIIYRSADGLIEGVWTLQRDDLIHEACQRLPRNMTLEEWQYYLGDEAYRKTCSNLPYHPSVIQHQIEQAENFVIEGNVLSATVTYERTVQAISEIYDYHPVAEIACRSGASYGFAELVLPACDRAIDLLVSNSFLRSSSAVNYHNARGLARALSGDLDGAIQDFEFVVAKWEEQSACKSSTINQCSKWQDLINMWSTGQHLNQEEILDFLGYYDVLVDSPEFKLPLREGPEANYQKLSQLPNRTGLKSLETPEVTRDKIGQFGQWLYVRTFYGEEGYVAAWYLRLPYAKLEEIPPEKSDEIWEGIAQLVKVVSPDKPLILRQGPSSNHSLLGYLTHATILESLESPSETRSKVGQLDQWLHVRTPEGLEGYVVAWYLCLLEE